MKDLDLMSKIEASEDDQRDVDAIWAAFNDMKRALKSIEVRHAAKNPDIATDAMGAQKFSTNT